jgi:hypothetical protein
MCISRGQIHPGGQDHPWGLSSSKGQTHVLKTGLWQCGLVVSSQTATEETEAMGPEIESRQDTHRVVVSKKF